MNQRTNAAAPIALDAVVDALVASYRSSPRGHHINRRYLPSRNETIAIIDLLLQVFYPGYFGRQDLTDENLRYHVGGVLGAIESRLSRQIELALCYKAECEEHAAPAEDAQKNAHAITRRFLADLPSIRETLLSDVTAAYEGDPAAPDEDEIILAYPGLLAITVYRVANALFRAGVPLLPRIMTEWAHTQSGADIHPGASIGKSFFIDHATGAVIGETTTIGDHVKLYQGVTLGAISHPRDEEGKLIREHKRHPTVEDAVTIYANATVLGGETTIGRESTIGGSVFLTRSVPSGARVALKAPELKVRSAADSATELPSDPEP